jgi:hypothetical protein
MVKVKNKLSHFQVMHLLHHELLLLAYGLNCTYHKYGSSTVWFNVGSGEDTCFLFPFPSVRGRGI